MNLENLVNFHNCLAVFNPNEPILVTMNNHGLEYRQLGKVVRTGFIDVMYFRDKDIKIGILTPNDFKELMDNLEKLIQTNNLNDGGYSMSVKDYGWEVYRLIKNQHLYGPQLYLKFKLVTFKSKFISSLILRYYSPDSKALLKSIKNENRENKRKSNQQE